MNVVVRDTPALALQTLFQPIGAAGVFARTALLEQVVEGLNRLITSERESGAEVFRFPPVMSRAQIETSGYLHSFPNLLGAVCCLHGKESEILAAVDPNKPKSAWVGALSPTDLVLTPAACYPLYPMVASRGAIPQSGLLFDVNCDCFRHEPSQQIDRLQSFRMREFVRMGQPDHILAFRKRWKARGEELADILGLKHEVAPASDPFFGRVGKMLAASQVEQALKFELLIPVRVGEQPTACMSFNYHQDHFGKTWDLRTADGAVAHTGCVAFGIDRLALALFTAHGLDLKQWPASARSALAL